MGRPKYCKPRYDSSPVYRVTGIYTGFKSKYEFLKFLVFNLGLCQDDEYLTVKKGLIYKVRVS